MSWNAVRYEKSQIPSRVRRRAASIIHPKRTAKLRADDQRMVTRLASETNEAIEGGALEGIFGSSSVAYALRVALRIKRVKGRDTTLPPWGNFSEGNTVQARRRLRGRNIHHMTPKSRKGQVFFGNGIYNLLLLKVPRHDLLHKEFGVRTWEEIIILLARCAKMAWHASFGAMIDALVPELPYKKMRRRMERLSLRDLQLFGESPGCSGLFY